MIKDIHQQSLVPWIGKTGKMLSSFLNQRLHEEGLPLTTKQWILLRILDEADGRPQNELALITERDKASLVRLINSLEKNKLVKRVQDPEDKRVNRIYLSEKGREVFQQALPVVNRSFTDLQKGLDKSEIEDVIRVLKKVLDNICQSQLA
ncbi:MAG: MarR family transcriptional regulator [Saprospiraceae bacterium]|nr:MarR family transcriptional regulator [Saprospiraceae bacterium]